MQDPSPPPPPIAAIGGYARPVRTSGLAIASLVLGILWLFGGGSILAVIFGHISLRQINRGERDGKGLAIAGLVLGYVGLAGLVAWVLFAVLLAGIAANTPTPTITPTF
jgi:hypothetical protein